ncbi:diguanylate cyclase [Pseudomonas japonica]|uniref:diguanylate cyclase n=1 Tax=Pseudomonas japonica TaxID=256466 RepID=UPI0015E3482D|nr:diguanylate cyclase [Pseudomonas japonica]MBA1245449.1 GGDEF domain-containing protein [Pseudomonas japonica]
MPYRKASLVFAATLATVVMTLTAAVGPVTLLWTNQTRLERNKVEQELESVRTVQALVVDAETGQRGYALTGKERFLQPYYITTSLLPGALRELREAYAARSPEDINRIDQLIKQVDLRMEHLDHVINLRSGGGFEAAEAEVSNGHGKALMDHLRSLCALVLADGYQERALLEERLERNLRWAVGLSAASFLLALALVRFIFVSMRRTIQQQTSLVTQQKESSAAAIAASAELNRSLERLEQRNHQIGMIAELAQLLQSELNQEETLKLASSYCRRSLARSSGIFYLYRNSADVLMPAARWGTMDEAEGPLLNPKDCWAVRRGRRYVVGPDDDVRCGHYTSEADPDNTWHVCLPLTAYGEILGLLHICFPGVKEVSEASLQCSEAIAEQTALALANGRMRQVLQSQSIKDPLTGLYNRRFMEETLERELARAKRSDSTLSVVMLDLDNFKSLNDTYGHPAGDAVLQACAALLKNALRSSDIACRFGGEELLVILPDCGIEDARIRAEAIRSALEKMSHQEIDGTFKVTGSFGVASTRECGLNQGALLKAADAALYKAKKSGKNKVEQWLSLLPVGTGG